MAECRHTLVWDLIQGCRHHGPSYECAWCKQTFDTKPPDTVASMTKNTATYAKLKKTLEEHGYGD